MWCYKASPRLGRPSSTRALRPILKVMMQLYSSTLKGWSSSLRITPVWRQWNRPTRRSSLNSGYLWSTNVNLKSKIKLKKLSKNKESVSASLRMNKLMAERRNRSAMAPVVGSTLQIDRRNQARRMPETSSWSRCWTSQPFNSNPAYLILARSKDSRLEQATKL